MLHIAKENSKSKLTSKLDNNQIQPNAVDVKIDKVFAIGVDDFILTEDEKQHRSSSELKPDQEGFFNFEPGRSYEVIMEGEVSIAEGEAGWIVPRSTLNRNGLFITSGLYDSNYKGVLAGVLHVTSGEARIKKGTRVGQFLLFKAETDHLYDGDYGSGKQADKERYENDK